MSEKDVGGGETPILIGAPTGTAKVEGTVPRVSLLTAWWNFKTENSARVVRTFFGAIGVMAIVILIFAPLDDLFFMESFMLYLTPYRKALLFWMPLIPFIIGIDIFWGAKIWRKNNEE